MTPEQTLLIAALENIDTSKGTDGICRQVRMYVAPEGHYNLAALGAIELMDKLMQEWPESSTDLLYPVPNPNKILRGSAYRTFCWHHDRGTLWKGKYGKKRKELIAWMLSDLKGAEAPK